MFIITVEHIRNELRIYISSRWYGRVMVMVRILMTLESGKFYHYDYLFTERDPKFQRAKWGGVDNEHRRFDPIVYIDVFSSTQAGGRRFWHFCEAGRGMIPHHSWLLAFPPLADIVLLSALHNCVLFLGCLRNEFSGIRLPSSNLCFFACSEMSGDTRGMDDSGKTFLSLFTRLRLFFIGKVVLLRVFIAGWINGSFLNTGMGIWERNEQWETIWGMAFHEDGQIRRDKTTAVS